MPTELMRQSRKRMKALVLTLGAFSLAGVFFNGIGPEAFGWREDCARAGLVAYSVMVALSVGFGLLLHKSQWPAHRLLALGRIYQVVFCFIISLSELSVPHPEGPLTQPVSFVCVLIVLFPLFLPTSRGKTAITALAAATTGPLAALSYSAITGVPVPGPVQFFWAYLLNYVTAGMSIIPASILFRLGCDVSEARRLGSYELVEPLGHGGMGEVWRAKHRMLRRPAAIKLIRPEKLGESDNGDATNLLRRFEREAQATAGLHSHHTIELYDFGITAEGTFFYVMELLDGFDLETLVEEYGPLPAERCVHLLLQVCDSLQDAHLSGLIHRDIKPANIYLCRYGHRDDMIKVLDFGLVKATGDFLAGGTRLTGAGQTTGTPAYMSPELALGEEVIDARADIYALGCVAYWLLTGQLVFDATSPMKLVLQHVQDEPVPPSERTELSIPEALDEVILHCLRKSPDERPQSAAEVARALERVPLPSAWDAERATRWWQTHAPPTGRGLPKRSDPALLPTAPELRVASAR
jgi:serine/threonine-protein kinase